MLVSRMQKVAEERGLEANISAIGDSEIKEAGKKADVILLGPQIKFQLKNIKEAINNEKPVTVIDTVTYGTMNGEKAIDLAISEYENFNK